VIYSHSHRYRATKPPTSGQADGGGGNTPPRNSRSRCSRTNSSSNSVCRFDSFADRLADFAVRSLSDRKSTTPSDATDTTLRVNPMTNLHSTRQPPTVPAATHPTSTNPHTNEARTP
jgi:hypothetical protein